jgi:hypothetical protein
LNYWRVAEGAIWLGAFFMLLLFLVVQLDQQQAELRVGMAVLLMLVCLGAGTASLLSGDEEHEGLGTVVRRRTGRLFRRRRRGSRY